LGVLVLALPDTAIADCIDRSNLEFISRVGESPIYAAQISGGQLYLGNEDGLSIIDLEDLNHPRRLGKVPLCAPVSDLSANSGMVYVSLADEGFARIDVSDPSGPVLRQDPHLPWQVLKATEDRLYIWHRSKHNFRILDRSGSALPVIGRYTRPELRADSSIYAAIDGDLAYLPYEVYRRVGQAARRSQG
jgi:hypothetical protein